MTLVFDGKMKDKCFTIEDVPGGDDRWVVLSEENNKRMWANEAALWASAQNFYTSSVKYHKHHVIIDGDFPNDKVYVFAAVVEPVPKVPQTLIMFVRKIDALEVDVRCHEPIGELVGITTSSPWEATFEIRRDATLAKLKKVLLQQFVDFGASKNWGVKVLVDGREGFHAANTRVHTVLRMDPFKKSKLPPKGTCRIEKFARGR